MLIAASLIIVPLQVMAYVFEILLDNVSGLSNFELASSPPVEAEALGLL